MKKPELVEAIASKTELTKKDVDTVVSSMIDTIVEQLKAGEEVDLYGFGKFEVIDQAPREVRNPKTGEKKMNPAKKNPKFRISYSIKKLLNE